MHNNPVKHGLVAAVAHWPYSTFHSWVQAGGVSERVGREQVAKVGAGERTR